MKRDLKLDLSLDVVKDLAHDVWEDLDRTRTRAVAAGLVLALLAITALALRPHAPPDVPESIAAATPAPTQEVSFAIPGEEPMRISDLELSRPRDPFRSLGDLGSSSAPPTMDQIVTAAPAGSGGGTTASYDAPSALMPIDDLGGSAPARGPASAPAPAAPQGDTPVAQSDDEPAPPTDYSYAADLQFGPRGGLERYANVQRLGLVPSRREPHLMYLGVRPDRRTAVFMVDSRLSQGGEGRCVPKRTQCTFLELQARPERDEHSFRDADGKEYLLRLRKLFRTTASAGSRGERDAGNLPGTPPLLDGER